MHTRPCSTRPPTSLVSRSPGYGAHKQALHACSRIINLLLRKAGVDYVNYAIDGQRCLRDIRRNDNFSASRTPRIRRFWRRFEYSLLLLGWQGGVEG